MGKIVNLSYTDQGLGAFVSHADYHGTKHTYGDIYSILFLGHFLTQVFFYEKKKSGKIFLFYSGVTFSNLKYHYFSLSVQIKFTKENVGPPSTPQPSPLSRFAASIYIMKNVTAPSAF